MCGEAPATERHHIVTRNATQGNDAAKEIANGPLLTALLCQECHVDIDTTDNRGLLIQNLYRINGRGDAAKGREVMLEQFEIMVSHMLYPPLWRLPDVE